MQCYIKKALMNELTSHCSISDEFNDDPTIPKPTFYDDTDGTIQNLSQNNTPNNSNIRLLSPECQALLKSDSLFSPPRFSSGKSPYDINEQPFSAETDVQGNTDEDKQQDEYVSIPIEIPEQFAPISNSAPTPPLNQNVVPKKKQNEIIGINNFNPNKFCTFTDSLTLKAIENMGAVPRDLFYPTEAQLSKYSKDPDMKEIARQHQIEMIDKVIAIVKNERERLSKQSPGQQIPHARTQQTTPRNSSQLPIPKTLPVSKKRAIEQILASKVKQNRSRSKIANSQLQSLNQNRISSLQGNQTQSKRPTTSLANKNERKSYSDKSSFLVEKMATIVNRAKDLEEKQKEERQRQFEQRELRAQRRMEELQYIKYVQNQQLRIKNEQKKQQNNLFNQKWKNENLQLIEEREANEAKERAEAKRDELNKQLASEIVRLAHDASSAFFQTAIAQDAQSNTKNKNVKQQTNPNENTQKPPAKEMNTMQNKDAPKKNPKENELKQKKLNENELTPEQLQKQQELLQNLIEKQIEQQMKLEGIRNNRQSILDAKREKVEKAQIEHEERARLFREAEEKRRKKRNLISELSNEEIKRRREMKDRIKLNERQERVDRTLKRFEAIDQQQKEMQTRAAIARRTPLSVEEANLCRCYEKALQLGDNPDEKELVELAQQVGINYDALKNRIMS